MTTPTGEFELIDWIRQRVPTHPQVPLGIGDDAAWLKFPPQGDTLVTVDMLLEGVHFTLETATPFQIGWKSLAVNLSDIAAMGGRAVAAVVSIALPRNRAWELAEGIQQGIDALAARFGVAIAGGDTNSWDGPLVISITAMGQPNPSGPVRRGGARPGDWILVTGDLGGSILGHHLDFVPRLNEIQAIVDRVRVHSLIDISDGLAADLHHILDESRVGATLTADSIPIANAAHQLHDGRTPLDHALSDGEDFELLMTMPEAVARELLSNLPDQVRLIHIGEIIAGQGCELVFSDGRREELPPRGYRHPFAEPHPAKE